MSRRVLITGANRGIGLEFARQLLAAGDQVTATCRNPAGAEALNELASEYPGSLEIAALEVTDPSSIEALAASFADRRLDLLINNAGVYGPRQFKHPVCDADEWLRVLAVNTVAPYQVSMALADSLKGNPGAMIVSVSSRMGSIADNDSGGAPIYRSSKAGLNAAMKSLAIDMQQHDVVVLILHPGWVKTDMGGDNALIDAETSVRGMLEVIARARREPLSGRFFHSNGEELPW